METVGTFTDRLEDIDVARLDEALYRTGDEMHVTVAKVSYREGIAGDQLRGYLNGDHHPMVPRGMSNLGDLVWYWTDRGYRVEVWGWDFDNGEDQGPFPVVGFDDYTPGYAHFHCSVRPVDVFGVDPEMEDDHMAGHEDMEEGGTACAGLGEDTMCLDFDCLAAV